MEQLSPKRHPGQLWKNFRAQNRVRNLRTNCVLTYRGRPIKDIKEGFKNALEKADIQNFRFHDLRHTFNTNMRKAGVNQTVIMKLTGHKTLAMFSRYNTVDQDDAVKAMQRLNFLLSEQKTKKSSNHVQTTTAA